MVMHRSPGKDAQTAARWTRCC